MDYVLVLGAFAVFAAGSPSTASVFLSPKIEVAGVITNTRMTGVKSRKYFVTVAIDKGLQKEFEVTRDAYGFAEANDSVRVTYREWDNMPTRLEVVEGRRRGQVWQEGFLDFGMGPIAILLGGVALWALIRSWIRRKHAPRGNF